MVYGGIIGLIIGIITSLGQSNDNFVYIYAAPIYIYSYIFDRIGNENIAIYTYYSLVGFFIGYLYSVSLSKNGKLSGIIAIILLHLGLTILGGRAISKNIKEFLNSMPAEMIVDAMSGKTNQ